MWASMSTVPSGDARVGKVGAIGTGPDGAAEMLLERGIVLTDPRDGLTNRAGHGGSSAFGRGCCPSIATTQADCARELSNEEVAFDLSLGSSLRVPDGKRLVDVVVDLGEASTVRVLGSRIEHLPCVAEYRAP